MIYQDIDHTEFREIAFPRLDVLGDAIASAIRDVELEIHSRDFGNAGSFIHVEINETRKSPDNADPVTENLIVVKKSSKILSLAAIVGRFTDLYFQGIPDDFVFMRC